MKIIFGVASGVLFAVAVCGVMRGEIWLAAMVSPAVVAFLASVDMIVNKY